MSGETVLVIDDSPTIRKVVASNLTRAGYSVESACDGQDGLEVAQQVNPQLILLDFVMPRMNGFQFCRALREISNLARVPVVLMSAKGDKIGAKFIQQMGAVDSITKPFSPEALLAVSTHVLAKYREGADDVTAKIDLLGEAEPEDIDPIEGPLSDEVLAGDEELSGEVTSPGVPAPAPVDEGDDPLAPRLEQGDDPLASWLVELVLEAIPELSDRREALVAALQQTATPAARAEPARALGDERAVADSAPLTGDIAVVPLAEVLQMLQLQNHNGCFEIARDRFRVKVHFRHGKIDLAQAEEGRSEFLLGRYMVEEEIISRAELEHLLRNRSENDSSLLGQQLVSRGYLTPDDLARLLERQSCELVYEVLRWRRGRFALFPGRICREAESAQLGLSVEAILLEGFRRVDEWRLIEQSIEDFDVLFIRDDAAIERFGVERLTGEEQTVLEAVDGRRTVRDVVEMTQMGSFLVSKLLYRLMSVKLIQKRGVE